MVRDFRELTGVMETLSLQEKKYYLPWVTISRSRNLGLLLITLVCSCLSAPTIIDFLHTSDTIDYSHILLLPVISGYLLFSRRKSISRDAQYAMRAGMMIAATGICLYGSAWYLQGKTSGNDHAAFVMLSTLIIWTGGFLALYGKQVLRNTAFPIAFLLFMVPLPDIVLESAVSLLRAGSAEVANGIFAFSGVPFFRTGFTFHFVTLNIEVARECSGIRSFIALSITSVIAGNYFLRSGWSRIILLLFVIPIAIFKNGIRIAVLSLIGAHVDERILQSDLHRKGGILFFVIALILIGVVIELLKRTEAKYC
jgi:exosortase